MDHNFAFIALLGRRDLQVVLRDEDHGLIRHEIDFACMRAFHQFCLDQPELIQVMPLSESAAIRRGKPLWFESNECLLSTGHGRDPVFQIGPGKDNPVVLCSPILAEGMNLIQSLRENHQLGDAVCAVLLNTRRDNTDHRHDDEPIAVGQVVKESLADALGISTDAVKLVDFLVGSDSLYVESDEGERFLLPTAAKRIDEAVQAAASTPGVHMAGVMDMAGMPEAKPVVLASCRYRFGEKGFRVIRPDPLAYHDDRPHIGMIIDPASSFEVRMRVTHLIHRGDFEGAAALAMLYPEGIRAEPWRSWLPFVTSYLNGRPVINENTDSSILSHLRTLRELPHPVAIAFRIENALRRGDIPHALMDTATLTMTLVLSLADRDLRKGGDPCVDWMKGTVDRERMAEISALKVKSSLLDISDYKTRSAIIEVLETKSNDQNLSRLNATVFGPDVLPVINMVHYCYSAAQGDHATAIQAYANTLGQAAQCLVNASIWIRIGQEAHFLTSPVLIRLFSLLSINDAQEHYDNLVKAIETDMERWSLQYDS